MTRRRPATKAKPQPAASAAADGARRPLTFNDLADLGGLKRELKAEAERREAELRAARERQMELEREARVFRRAVADVAPLGPSGRIARAPAAVPPIARQHHIDERQALAQSLSDEIDIERLLETDERLSFCRPGVGPESLRKLRRGHWVTQAQLDLHGLRTDEAREAVAAFVGQCARDGLRCVRIIHGKGLGSLNRQPVLKDKTLRWLAQRQEVIAFCQAPPFAGGSGALLVLLKGTGSN
jgi:DNA-nicking Smr family endonuclease